MSDFRRYFVAGGTYFFTVVTDQRFRLFDDASARSLLGSILRRCAYKAPFETIAVCLLPDHVHAIWALPREDANYSTRWGWIKSEFTRAWLTIGGRELAGSAGRRREGRRNVWQPRFWEHTIRDESELQIYADYIHFNPVKHRLVNRPCDWVWSSFHRWVARGHYDIHWGADSESRAQPRATGE